MRSTVAFIFTFFSVAAFERECNNSKELCRYNGAEERPGISFKCTISRSED